MVKKLELVDTPQEIIANVKKFHKYHNSASEDERKFYADKIKNSSNFICYEETEKRMFCPSKFAGYKNNDIKFYKDGSYKERGGNYTDIRINNVLKCFAELDNGLLDKLSKIVDINTNRNNKKQCF